MSSDRIPGVPLPAANPLPLPMIDEEWARLPPSSPPPPRGPGVAPEPPSGKPAPPDPEGRSGRPPGACARVRPPPWPPPGGSAGSPGCASPSRSSRPWRPGGSRAGGAGRPLLSWAALAAFLPALLLGADTVRRGLDDIGRLRPTADSAVALGALAALLAGGAAAALAGVGQLEPPSSVGAGGSPALGLPAACVLLALPHLEAWLLAGGDERRARLAAAFASVLPGEARVMGRGGESLVPAAILREGERFSVHPGEKFPADGTIWEGSGSVLPLFGTGESLPRGPGDRVRAGDRNGGTALIARARGREPALSRALAPAARLLLREELREGAGRLRRSGVIALGAGGAALAALVLARRGVGFGEAAGGAIGVLAASWSPRAAMAPASRKAVLARALAAGAVPRDERVLAELRDVEIALFSRTGTLTGGHPRLVEVVPIRPGIQPKEVLLLAMTLELRSDHPLAEGILRSQADAVRQTLPEVRGFQVVPGKGLRGMPPGEAGPPRKPGPPGGGAHGSGRGSGFLPLHGRARTHAGSSWPAERRSWA